MSAPIIAFFNSKAGVGRTTLVYHLAWMYADLGIRVVAADLDPQANLTAAFVGEERLDALWADAGHPDTIFGCVQPLLSGIGDIAEPHLEIVDERLGLVMGDLSLYRFEGELHDQWPQCLDRKERAFRVISAFWRILQRAATRHAADVALVDLGPNLGAINRAALIGSDHVVVPLSPDPFSVLDLKNLGPTLREWRRDWGERRGRNPVTDLSLPTGSMQPAGYVVLQHSVRLGRPVKAYDRWIPRIPEVYGTAVLGKQTNPYISVVDDPHCLAVLRPYRSLVLLAQEARKPMFHLKPADGAIGAHMQAVQSAYADFQKLAREIAKRTEVKIP